MKRNIGSKQDHQEDAMENNKASRRRHHDDRVKNNRRSHWGRDISEDPKAWGKSKDTPTPCSCAACGNPRKYFGELTHQECKQHAVDINDDSDEWDAA